MSQANSGAGTGLFLNGTRESGPDVRTANVTAAVAVANIVKSSLGPVGLDKMLVDDIGDVTITNDGATILSQLEVEHPAARILVDLAQLQDNEVGDGTTSVVIIAAELLKRANDLIITFGLHPTTVIAGYRLALKQSISWLKNEMVLKIKDLKNDGKEEQLLMNAAKTSMSSKILGAESDFFAKMAVDAVKSVAMKSKVDNKKTVYPLSAIHILKSHGKSSLDSQLVDGGFALNAQRAAQGMVTSVGGGGDSTTTPIKIAMLDMNLQRHRMAMGIQVLVDDPKEIENIKKRELDIVKERIDKILEKGTKVVLTTKGIDDTAMKYFVEAGVLCARRCNKDDLRRLAKATGGKVITTLADMDGNESLDEDALGTCDAFSEVRMGDSEMLYAYGCKGHGASTIILRGANEYMLDEMDRALHDSLCVVKRMLESNALVPGGGATESALSIYLEEYATSSLPTREQLAVQEFAQALLIIPKTLAVNAAKDSSELLAKLRAVHAKNQKGDGDASKYAGLDLIEGTIRDNLEAGVVEPAISKIKSLRFATEAAITILRIDDRITLNQK